MAYDLETIIANAMQYRRYPREVNGATLELGGCGDTLKESALKLTEEQVKAFEEAWEETEKHNQIASRHNRGLQEEALKVVENFCKALGIQTWKRSSPRYGVGKIIGEYKEFKAMKNALETRLPTHSCHFKPRLYNYMVDGKQYRTTGSPSSLSGLIEEMRHTVENIEKKKEGNSKMLRSAITHEAYRDIDNPETLSDKEIVAIVDEKARQQWVEENYPDGEEVSFDQCDECDTWVVGERRCSCGNRRVDLCVEGNFVDGFYGYPEAY